MSLLFESDNELKRDRIHSCSGEEFINAFCSYGDRGDYKDAIVNIFDYAKYSNARRVFVGGSFISLNGNPNDFDCLIVFNSAEDIPNFVDTNIVGNIEFDILFASEDNPRILDSFLDLFKSYKNRTSGKPIVEIILDNTLNSWKVKYIPSSEECEVIRKIYTKRTVIERRKSRGILFSIHGVNTKAYWNSKLAPLASSQGWIFAPFIYENPITLLICPTKRQKVSEAFGKYFNDVVTKYEVQSVSIITHSFGTYIIAKYLLDRLFIKFLKCEIDSIILTGAIVNENFNWEKYYPSKIGRVLNISSPNDKAVRWMPKYNFIKRHIMREKDNLFGRIGYDGLKISKEQDKFITEMSIPMLGHCNIFSDEILTGIIMPFLNGNVGICRRKFNEEFIIKSQLLVNHKLIH